MYTYTNVYVYVYIYTYVNKIKSKITVLMLELTGESLCHIAVVNPCLGIIPCESTCFGI